MKKLEKSSCGEYARIREGGLFWSCPIMVSMPHPKIWTIAGPPPQKSQIRAEVAPNSFPKISPREKVALRYYFEQKPKIGNARFAQKAAKSHKRPRCGHEADA